MPYSWNKVNLVFTIAVLITLWRHYVCWVLYPDRPEPILAWRIDPDILTKTISGGIGARGAGRLQLVSEVLFTRSTIGTYKLVPEGSSRPIVYDE